MFVSLSLCVFLSVTVFVCLSLCLFASPSVFVCLSLCLFITVCVCLSLSLCLFVSLCVFVCLPLSLPALPTSKFYLLTQSLISVFPSSLCDVGGVLHKMGGVVGDALSCQLSSDRSFRPKRQKFLHLQVRFTLSTEYRVPIYSDWNRTHSGSERTSFIFKV